MTRERKARARTKRRGSLTQRCLPLSHAAEPIGRLSSHAPRARSTPRHARQARARRPRSPAGRPQVASFRLRAQPPGLPRMEVSHALGGPGDRPTATVAQGFRWHRVCALFQPKFFFHHMCSSAELTMGWERGRSLAPRRALAVPQKKFFGTRGMERLRVVGSVASPAHALPEARHKSRGLESNHRRGLAARTGQAERV